ncbi:MAG: hypothetical protein QNJ73_09725 [Gammaproteobacteria bacterium]|nr:hypothetical protein [Gammaproteobacteria bacterium]
MLRLLGFIAGAVVAIGTIVVVMGTPELIQAPTEDATDELALALDVPAAQAPPMAPEPVAEPETIPAPEPLVEAELLADLDLLTEAELPIAELPDLVEPPTNVVSESPALPVESPAPVTDELDPHWHAFWNPFRSQIAANGFAARLTAVTDIDYRVLRRKPGVYEVAFAYTDDSERVAKLAQIESATGLTLPEATP